MTRCDFVSENDSTESALSICHAASLRIAERWINSRRCRVRQQSPSTRCGFECDQFLCWCGRRASAIASGEVSAECHQSPCEVWGGSQGYATVLCDAGTTAWRIFRYHVCREEMLNKVIVGRQ